MKQEAFIFELLQPVQKRKGYRWPGIVIGRCRTLQGKARYIVECTVPEVKGALHIYSGKDLKRRGQPSSRLRIGKQRYPL